MKALGIGAAIAAAIVLLVICEVRVWQECLTDHSFLYCMRVLGK